jgi:hypothetical protein
VMKGVFDRLARGQSGSILASSTVVRTGTAN